MAKWYATRRGRRVGPPLQADFLAMAWAAANAKARELGWDHLGRTFCARIILHRVSNGTYGIPEVAARRMLSMMSSH
jgi:hypothetical protein